MTLESSPHRQTSIRIRGSGAQYTDASRKHAQEQVKENENMAALTLMAVGTGVSAWSSWRNRRAQKEATAELAEGTAEGLADARAIERFNRTMHAQQEARLMPYRQFSMNMLSAFAPGAFEGDRHKIQLPTAEAFDPTLATQEDPEEMRLAHERNRHPAFGANDHLYGEEGPRGYAPPETPGPQAAQYLQAQASQPQSMAEFQSERGIPEADPGLNLRRPPGAPGAPGASGPMNMGSFRNI